VDTTPPGRGGVLARTWPLAAPGLGSSSARVRHGEGRVAYPFRSSPGCERWSSDDGKAVMGMKLSGGGALAQERGRGEQGWVRWRTAGALPFYIGRRGGEKAASGSGGDGDSGAT
jgi:hypothetical protein